MAITNVVWVRDHLGHSALDLVLDGQQAHIRSSQRTELLDRGIVEGIDYLKSERTDPAKNRYIRGSYAPAISDAELVGCTDDPRVYALYMEMCNAIRTGTWVAGTRSQPV